MSARFLAFDLGAESGRAILGRLDGGVLVLKDIYRFPNEPVRNNGALQWDILRLWHEMRKGLELVSDISLASVGLDTWGCDYALLGETGNLLENPYHYRDTRTDGIQDEVFRHVSAERIYSVTGIQFLPFNTLFQLYAAKRSTPRLLDAATAFVTIPDLLNYWLTGRLCVRIHQRDDDAAGGCANADLEHAARSASSVCRRDCSSRFVEPGAVVGGIRESVSPSLADTPVVAPGLSRHRIGVRRGLYGRRRRVPQLGHVVAARR